MSAYDSTLEGGRYSQAVSEIVGPSSLRGDEPAPTVEPVTAPPTMPDENRLGGVGWLHDSRGRLGTHEWRILRRAIYRELAAASVDRLRLNTRRRPTDSPSVPAPPDSAAVRAAEAHCLAQHPSVEGHARRTWAFGRALAAADGVDNLDEELFYIGCLLHDVTLEQPTPGEDFTLESGAIAAGCLTPHHTDAQGRLLQDMISAHCTPGASVGLDGEHAVYVQAGATADLIGRRLADLSAPAVAAIHEQHPRGDLAADFVAFITAEADAVPRGRFALLRRHGFTLAIRASPSRRVP